MKTKFASIIIITIVKFSLGQDPCVNQANTFPGVTPTPVYLQNIPYADSKFLNNWIYWMTLEDPNTSSIDYQIPIYDMGMNPGEYYSITPGNPPLTGYMGPLNSEFFQGYYNYLNEFIVHNPNQNVYDYVHPENGWELLSVNRGWYPDNETTTDFITNAALRKVPYILLYNKYSGIARIYVRYGNNVDPDASTNFADITIQHLNNNEMTGMLRLANGMDRSLDQNSVVKKLRMRIPSPGDASLWFSADFQMHYDPCVCEYDSKIQVLFDFYNVSSLTLTGRSVELSGAATSEPLMDAASSFLDFNGAYDFTSLTPNEGFLIYQHYSSLVDDYLKKLEKYQEKLEDVERYNANIDSQLAVLKIAKQVLSLGVTGVTGVTGMPGFLALLGKIPSVKKAFEDNNSSFNKDVQKEFFKELDKVLSLGFDFIIKENLKKKDNPTKPSTPTASISEMVITGSSFDGNFANGPNINTPGSKNAHVISDIESQFEFPIYNEALGVFALLEKPKVKISQKKYDFSWDIWEVDTVIYDPTPWLPLPILNDITIGYPEFHCSENLQIALSEPLKFVFNPALKIKDYKIDVVFDIKANISNTSLSDKTPNILYEDIVPYNVLLETRNNQEDNVNINGFSFETDNNDQRFLRKTDTEISTCVPNVDSIIHFNTVPVNIDAVNSMLYSIGVSHSIKYPDVFRHYSGILAAFPVPYCQTDYTFFLHGDNDIYELLNSQMGAATIHQYSSDGNHVFQQNFVNPNYYGADDFQKIEIQSIIMKLIIDVEFEGNNLDGTPREHSYLFSYEIDVEDNLTHGTDPINWNNLPQVLYYDNHQFNPSLAGSLQDYTQFDEVVIYNGLWFNGAPVENCVLTGTHYECKSHYSIEIQGDVDVTPPYTVRFVAPEIITVLPETIIVPEVELVIEPIFDMSNPNPPQNPQQVSTFCTGTLSKYEANQLERSIVAHLDSIAQSNPKPQPEPEPLEFSIFPNPTNGSAQALVSLPEMATVSITLIDLTGKVIGEPIQNTVMAAGRNLQNLQTEGLSPGVYFVHLVVNGEKYVERLVKR